MVLNRIQRIADVGEVLEAAQLDSLPREHLLDLLPLVVDHKADFAFVDSADEDVFGFKGAFFNKDRGCYLRGCLVEVGFNDKALSLRVALLVKL